VPDRAEVDACTGKDRIEQNRLVMRVTWDFGVERVEQTFSDQPTMQTIPVSGVAAEQVTVTLEEDTGPAARDFTPISEIVVR
jgi:hypothetical protein